MTFSMFGNSFCVDGVCYRLENGGVEVCTYEIVPAEEVSSMNYKQEAMKLAELIQNNPELEVICVCDEDCGGDISAIGEITYCRIDACVHGTNPYGEDQCYFKYDTNEPKSTADLTEDDMEVLRGVFYNEDIDDMPDDVLVKKFQEIKWNPCIYVWIGVKA